MTNTKVNNNIIDLEELEIVSGGTVGELDDLIKALIDIPMYKDLFGAVGGHIPGANNAIAALMEEVLEKSFGIRADIDLGIAGTGLCSDPNTYVDISSGKSMTHAEVLKRIKG